MSSFTSTSRFNDTEQELQPSSVIERHSRSFSLAARMLPKRVRSAVHALYAWCRTVDDCVDSARSLHAAALELCTLENDLELMRRGRVDTVHPASQWLTPLVISRSIDVKHAQELIVGMRMDLSGAKIETLADLHRYCYHVAGTVGLMLMRLMGVKNPAAERHAIALGVAMQMTNIARDVREDALRGRSYLPGIAFPFATDAKVVRTEVERLLDSAETQYKIAEDGLRYLPWDCRFAIRMALSLYREIGREIKRRGYPVLLGRTVISRPRLAWVILKTAFNAVGDNLRIALDSLLSTLQGKTMNNPQLNQNPSAVARSAVIMSTALQAWHAVYLGLSLTLIMAAALFVLVYINPKDASYSYLPLLYSGGSLLCAFVFNRLAARCESQVRA
ncbi:MAG: phytoene/squalene synthase family protein [Pirellulaceae bacterium]|nr:phytoene/squalene synthase family protein [Pirellulaceae bacterium]